jgi:cephalosporin-C deacetylase
MRHDFPFDPTYGHDLNSLLKVPAPAMPDDFLPFWNDLYQRTRKCPTNVSMRPIPALSAEQRDSGINIFEIEFDSLDGFRAGGWLTVPADKIVGRRIVVGHGYGGRTGPDQWHSTPPAAMIFPCARGFDRSARPDIPNQSMEHVLHGIGSRDTYIHGRCAADLWAAASVLIEMFPDREIETHYIGGSFGGGIGAMAMAFDERFDRAFLDMPSFGNHPLRVTMQCVGSGEAVRQMYRSHPQILQVLKYFDAATAAGHIAIPTMVAPALFDPAVPPPGQFAIYNAIKVEKRLCVRKAAHFEYPGVAEDNAAIDRQREEWFATCRSSNAV